MAVNKPLVVPNVKPGSDAGDIHSVGGLNRFVIVVMR
jgi:hypothetical protein